MGCGNAGFGAREVGKGIGEALRGVEEVDGVELFGAELSHEGTEGADGLVFGDEDLIDVGVVLIDRCADWACEEGDLGRFGKLADGRCSPE